MRLTRLLLTLLPVSAVDKLSLETLFFQRTLGAVAVDKLVMDLLQVKLSQNSENVLTRYDISGMRSWGGTILPCTVDSCLNFNPMHFLYLHISYS